MVRGGARGRRNACLTGEIEGRGRGGRGGGRGYTVGTRVGATVGGARGGGGEGVYSRDAGRGNRRGGGGRAPDGRDEGGARDAHGDPELLRGPARRERAAATHALDKRRGDAVELRAGSHVTGADMLQAGALHGAGGGGQNGPRRCSRARAGAAGRAPPAARCPGTCGSGRALFRQQRAGHEPCTRGGAAPHRPQRHSKEASSEEDAGRARTARARSPRARRRPQRTGPGSRAAPRPPRSPRPTRRARAAGGRR